MAAPVFVNAGAADSDGFDTSSTPGLPASRVNGNILIAMITANGTGNARTFTWPGGWTVIGTPFSSTTGNSSIAYRFVDGTETAPAISLSGADSLRSQIFQYSGVYNAVPIGATHKTKAANGLVASDSGITLLSNNALTLAFIMGGSAANTMGAASGYTIDSQGSSFGVIAALSQSSPNTAGSTSTAVSSTSNNGANGFMTWSIELASEAAVTEVDITAAPLMGFSEAASLTNTALMTAAPTMGFSEAALVSLENIIPPAINEGFTVAATVTPERDLTAAPSLGFGANREPLKYRRQQPVVCITN